MMSATRPRAARLPSGERRERRSAKHISEHLAGRFGESSALLLIPCCVSATQRWGNNRCIVVCVLRRHSSVPDEKCAVQCSSVHIVISGSVRVGKKKISK